MTTGRGKGRTPRSDKEHSVASSSLSDTRRLYRALGARAGHAGSSKVKLNSKCGATRSGRGYLLARFLRQTLRRSPITVPFVPANFRLEVASIPFRKSMSLSLSSIDL